MSNLHFYNLRSRLGMMNLPHRMSEFNVGVEEGGDEILNEEFLARLPQSVVDTFTFSTPEEIDPKKALEVIAQESQKAIALIEDTLQDDEMQVVVGGDHSVAFCSVVALLRRLHSHSIGYIQVDSHPDINKIATSPTGNFHGMWMRPFIGDFEDETINQLVPHVLKPEQIMYIGNLDRDPEEDQVITGKNIKTLSVEDLRSEAGVEILKKFMNSFEHIHLDIDIDAFDYSIAPATGIPAEKGLLRKDFDNVIAEFVKKESRSLDVVEVNPQKEGAEKTIALAQDIILQTCSV